MHLSVQARVQLEGDWPVVGGSGDFQVGNRQDASELLKVFQEWHKIRVANFFKLFHTTIREVTMVFDWEQFGGIVVDVYAGGAWGEVEPR